MLLVACVNLYIIWRIRSLRKRPSSQWRQQPISSRRLELHDAARVRWQVSLPADALRVGANVLTVRFFLQAPLVFECS